MERAGILTNIRGDFGDTVALRLILVRHGETDWSAQHRYQGQTDVPLNEAGRRQARALARRLENQDISALYSSDLLRARQTAQEIVVPHRLIVRPEPRLREMAFGDWEGLTHAQVHARWPTERAAWFADPVHMPPSGAETVAQVVERVQAVLDDIVQAGMGQTVALVAHGAVLRALICTAIGLDLGALWRFGLGTASISELRMYDRGMVLTRLNDTNHLRDQEREGDQRNR
jgi:alpha-ribazole phosphatase